MLLIESPKELSGLRPQALDMELVHQETCPCCTNRLAPVAGVYAQQLLEVGACERCGYVGYISRPTLGWFERFYSDDWDSNGRDETRDAKVEIIECLDALNDHPITQFVKKNVGKNETVCDVGCGFGLAVHQMTKLGYKATGIEKSEHRRRFASECGARIVESLSECGTFDIVGSFHVMEHSYDPDGFIREIAAHQEDGGICFIGIPCQFGEPTMGVLLFLPHLHSFTISSLCALMGRHGYGVLNGNSNGCDMQFAFQKGAPVRMPSNESRYSIVDKLERGIHANGRGPLLWWHKGDDRSGFIEEDLWELWKGHLDLPRAAHAKRVLGYGNFPVEVQAPWVLVK